MTISNNLNAMNYASLQIDQSAKNISRAGIEATNTDPSNTQAVANTVDLTKEITGQIPQVISYEANANAIKTQNEMLDSLLDIKV